MGEALKEDLLRKVYYDLNSPASYAGVKPLYEQAKSQNPLITLKDVKNFLKSEVTYTLHRPLRRTFPRVKTVPSGLHTDWQCDLCVFDSIKRHNNGYRYLLVCIDLLSRQIFVAPTKTKKNTEMIDAFDVIFKKSKYTPWKLLSDDGTEFNGKLMREYYEKLGVEKYTMRSAPFHAGVVERANRTIKSRLYKYFTQNSTVRWVDVIDKIVENINSSYNRAIGMAPSSVTFENAEELHRRLYKSSAPLGRKPKFRTGEFVRISKLKGVFEKSYLPNYTDEIFKIYKVNRSAPPTYTLEDLNEEVIKGKFYEHELVATTLNTRVRIEKVLRRRVKDGEREALVKFMGQSGSVWVKESELV